MMELVFALIIFAGLIILEIRGRKLEERIHQSIRRLENKVFEVKDD